MIKLSKEVTKRISGSAYYTEENFIEDCKAYIKAVASGRILYTVTHVSASGMSRDINIKSFEGKMSSGYYRSYFRMFKALGNSFAKDSRNVRISGCGMNMLFHLNYTTIHQMHRMGFISKNKCDVLAQKVN